MVVHRQGVNECVELTAHVFTSILTLERCNKLAS